MSKKIFKAIQAGHRQQDTFAEDYRRHRAANPLEPTATLLCKLGSIVVHVEEMNSAKGHYFDKLALDTCMNDPEVQAWLAAMRKQAMLPVKR